MSLYQMLVALDENSQPIRVGLISAGKFGLMFLSQALHIPGIPLLAVSNLSIKRACIALTKAGWSKERTSPKTPGQVFSNAGLKLPKSWSGPQWSSTSTKPSTPH